MKNYDNNQMDERQVLIADGRKDPSRIVISQEAAEAFKKFLEENKDYLKNSAGVFHTDNHSNW